MYKEDLFEEMPIHSALIRLALPAVIGQIIMVLYNMADTFFIGLTDNNVKLTAVTICMPAFMALTAIANLFGVGGTSVISRALGKKNFDRASSTSAFSFWLCLFSSLLYSLLVFIFMDIMVDALGGTDVNVHKEASIYLIYTVVIAGVASSMNALMAHLVRSEGHSLHASLGVVLGGVVNIALDPLFMFVILPRGNEVLGAALATGLSNIIAFLYYLVLLYSWKMKRTTVLSVRLSKNSFKNNIPQCVLSAGLPACIMTLAENISYAILDKLISLYGLEAQAGIGVAKKINMLVHSTVRGITQGALPLLGYTYSTGNRKRTKKAVLTTVAYAGFAALLFTLILFAFAHLLVGLFIGEHNSALPLGIKFLRILCVGAPFSAIAYTFISFFQAVGHGGLSFLLALLRKGILDIPLMFISKSFIPPYGIVAVTPTVDIICCAVSIVMFIWFSSNHLKKNKARKRYNPITGKNEVIEQN